MFKRSLAFLCALAPFAFGTIRAIQTGNDLRMLWMAFASGVGAVAVLALGNARGRKPGAGRQAAATFVIATLLAGATAYLLGARAAPGIWLVAMVLAVFWAASGALLV